MSANTDLSVLVDDTDTNRIRYSDGQWDDSSGLVGEFNSTSHRTTSQGATATFVFNGTGVSVLGTIPSAGGTGSPSISSYSLDENPPVLFTAESSPVTVFRQLFYQSPSLPDGQHQLVITNLNDGDEFRLDYLLIQPSGSISTSEAGPPTNLKEQKTPSPPLGAILAGIVGGTVFITLLILACYLFYRRRKRAGVYVLKNEKRFIGRPERSNESGTIEPFTLIAPPPTHANERIVRRASIYKPEIETFGGFENSKFSNSARASPLTGASLDFFPSPIITQPTRRPPSIHTTSAYTSPIDHGGQHEAFAIRGFSPNTRRSVDNLIGSPRKTRLSKPVLRLVQHEPNGMENGDGGYSGSPLVPE